MFAKLISETRIDTDVPRRAEWQGRAVAGDLSTIPGLLPSLGYYPLDESAPEPMPQDGYHMEPRFAYDSDETPARIVRSWAEVADPPPAPRTFRRSWLAQWMRANGKWDAFKTLLAAPGAEDLAFLWETSTEFDEDHPAWGDAIAAVKGALSLSDGDADAMLDYGATGAFVLGADK